MQTAASLVLAIQDWLVGHSISDATARTFISLAETEANRRLRTREMVVRATATATEGYTALPSDFLEVISVTLESGAGKPLRAVTPDRADEIRKAFKGGGVQSYTISGGNIELLPSPGGSTPLELEYYARIPSLLTNTTSWLSERAPDLLFWGAMVHGATYVAEPDRAGFFRAEFERVLEILNRESERARYGASPLIVRPPARVYG